MATFSGYVIVALAAVCLVSAWPQQRTTQPTNGNAEEFDRVVWGSEERPYMKTNSPRPSASKPNTRRSQRLQTDLHSELDNDTRPQQQQQQPGGKSRQDASRLERQQQQQQARGKSRGALANQDAASSLERQRSNNATGRVLQVGARQGNNRTTPRSVVAASVRSQEIVRPSFQPRAHQSPVNRTAEIGGSGGKTTTTTPGSVATEGEGTGGTVPEGRGLPEARNNGSSTRVKLPSENIVFPGPSHDDQHGGAGGRHRHFVPPVVGKRPRCANTTTFCEEAVSDYPMDHLNRILEQQSVVFRNFFSTDVVPEANNISQRFDDAQDDSPICVSETHVVFPKVAQNKDNDWLYIVNLNDEMYKQGVRIEKCRSPDQPCAYSEGFPQTVQTFCKQKYIYRQMLAVTQDGTPKPDSFKLPSCCACHTMSLGDAVSRMGVDPNRQSPARRRRRS